MQVNALIDAASAIAGSDYKLAQTLGVPRQQISNWRHGVKTCTPEQQADLAAVAGLDPRQVLFEATVTKNEGTPRGDRLKAAVGKLRRGAGVTLSFGAAAVAVIAAVSERMTTMYRVQRG